MDGAVIAGAGPVWVSKDPTIIRTFLVKLFSKSFEECSLFEKRRHPETFIVSSTDCFKAIF
ncbi:hypothetical protein F1542_03020 [Komagataeibacter sp. FXV3]|nr:hypothetical protein [Komagataeibacter sp. FXV3]